MLSYPRRRPCGKSRQRQWRLNVYWNNNCHNNFYFSFTLTTLVDCTMKGLLDLPNEIMLRILHYVEPVQISTFLSTLRNLITLEDNEQLWQSLAGTFGITCKQPYGSWKELGFSGDLMTTCPHLQAVDCPCSLLRATSAIKHDTPCSCGQQSWACLEYGICLGNYTQRGRRRWWAVSRQRVVLIYDTFIQRMPRWHATLFIQSPMHSCCCTKALSSQFHGSMVLFMLKNGKKEKVGIWIWTSISLLIRHLSLVYGRILGKSSIWCDRYCELTFHLSNHLATRPHSFNNEGKLNNTNFGCGSVILLSMQAPIWYQSMDVTLLIKNGLLLGWISLKVKPIYGCHRRWW